MCGKIYLLQNTKPQSNNYIWLLFSGCLCNFWGVEDKRGALLLSLRFFFPLCSHVVIYQFKQKNPILNRIDDEVDIFKRR